MTRSMHRGIAIAVACFVLAQTAHALASSPATQAGWRYVEVEQLKPSDPEFLVELTKEVHVLEIAASKGVFEA